MAVTQSLTKGRNRADRAAKNETCITENSLQVGIAKVLVGFTDKYK